ncbi:MAG TPA: response regulator transcription factor [Chryseosolibacter sp.]
MVYSPFKTRILIIEKDKLLRESYSYLINENSKYLVVGSFESYSESVSSFKTSRPDIVLLDPDNVLMDDLRKIKQAHSSLRILIWTSNSTSSVVFDLLRLGIGGYILKKDDAFNNILFALDDISKGGARLSSQIARMVVNSFHINNETPLTQRETEVLNLMACGKSYSEISARLAIAKPTSRKHISNIYQKLKVKSKAQAIQVATDLKLINAFSRVS